jgi:GntR family transcriptional regulator/MocR family aminotransferase
VPVSGSTLAGPELFVELQRDRGALRVQLEDGLRGAVRDGRLRAGERMPSSRVLARDLGVSRRLVVDAYAQLAAEGYLVARRGSGTVVNPHAAGEGSAPAGEKPPRTLLYDFFPGAPDLAGFPRAAWLRAMRDVLREAPDQALGYPDPRGQPELRAELAAHLRRTRGVVADPGHVVVTGGCAQALALLARCLGEGARIAVEDPGLPDHRLVLEEAGAEVVPVRVDGHGIVVAELERANAAAVLVTPAHQSPTGVALTPDRRRALVAWAGAGRIVIEDDYDAEFRYDRAPLGALQGLDPRHVAYVGSASKVLAPGLRLGWTVVPDTLAAAMAQARSLADKGSPVLEQLALARFLSHGGYDRHLRAARRRYRLRRDTLEAALTQHLPGARLSGLAAGLHAVVRLPEPCDERALMRAARRRSVGVYPLGWAYAQPQSAGGALVLGYANLNEAAIAEGVRRLAEAVHEVRSGGAEGAGNRTS